MDPRWFLKSCCAQIHRRALVIGDFDRELLRRRSLRIADPLRSATQLPLLRVSNSFTRNLQTGPILNHQYC